MWHRLIKEYQDQGLLVEGPLNNLRKNEMHLSKPIKMKPQIPRATFAAKELNSVKPQPYHMNETTPQCKCVYVHVTPLSEL